MLVKLQAGAFEAGDAEQKGLDSIEREAMLVYAGQFDSMDGPVAITPEHLNRIADTHNGLLGRLKRMATGEVPLKHSPPIQLDHSTSAVHTVGRLVGELTVKDTEIDGEMKPALFGKVRILGADNVERVQDGRWTHLSIGADLDTGKLTELTITPFPAAPQASLLSRLATVEKRFAHGEIVHQAPQGYFIRWKRSVAGVPALEGPFDSLREAELHAASVIEEKGLELSAGDKMDNEKLKKHLMDKTQCSAEEADKKLAEMPDEEKSKLSKEIDDEEAKMAAEKKAEEDRLAAEKAEEEKKLSARKTALTAAKSKLTELSTGLKSTSESVRLKSREIQLTQRLAGLRAKALVTPAEIKKLDLADLAKKSDETIETLFKAFEARQPVILTGQYGSVTAENAAQVAAKAVEEKRTQEMLSNMPFTAASLKGPKGKRLNDGAVPPPQGEPMPPAVQADPSQTLDMAAFELAYSECRKLMESGDHDGAKERLKSFLASVMIPGGRMSEQTSEIDGQEQRMSALASDVQKLENGLEEIVKLVGSVLEEN